MSLPKAIRGAFLAAAAALALAVLAPSAASVTGTADLSVDVVDSPDPVNVGQEVAYTTTTTNKGPDAATRVRLIHTLAVKVDFVSAVSSQGSCDHPSRRRVRCALGELASGASATVVVRVRPLRKGPSDNTVVVNSRENDPRPADNRETERTRVLEVAPVFCAGRSATIVGTEGDDELVGREGPDVIAALGGNDSINGLGGDDIVCGSGGADSIRGEAGNDTVRGGGGDDRIRGGDGADNLRGKSGADNLAGGRGKDVLRGGGKDVCRGGPGADVKVNC